MGKHRWIVWGALLASLLMTSVTVAAPESYSIDWWVIAGGSGSGQVGDVALQGTAGQMVAGVGGSGDTVLGTGFWCILGACDELPLYTTYLPLVLGD